MNYLEKLNREQIKPVKQTEGAVLVVAGAGSGKTRVLTSRIAYLIDGLGVSPYNILAITFTNKAANEMRERLAAIIPGGDSCWVSTIHGMCVRILRSGIERLEGYNNNFTIYSESDKDRVLKRVVTDLHIEEESAVKNAKYIISNAKNACLSPEEYWRQNTHYPNIEKYIKIFQMYEIELRRSNSLDFDDLLVLTYKLLKACPDVLNYYADKFHYIHVDEFQDTNKIQYDIIKMLASIHKNIFVVGDDDQSIYGWRGAEIKHILNFHKDFNNASVFKLEQNYRSTKNILELANCIIKNNVERSSKVLWTENENGEKVDTFVADEETGEASFTAMKIRSLVQSGSNYSDFAVLMRINALSRAFEQEFTKYNIPYKVFGGFKFYERKEIKDLTAYLRILSNPLDDEAILRIINTPKRGIGEKTIESLKFYAKDNGLMLFDSVFDVEKIIDVKKSAQAKILEFKKTIVSLLADRESLTLYDLVTAVIEKTDFLSQFEDPTEENHAKKMNINEFRNSVLEFLKLNPSAGLNEFLSSITLSSDTDDIEEENCVTIATIHSVKGLEFDTVFIAGLDENIFPISRAIGEAKEMEEERRLMYVAITRAKRKLFITRSRSRFLYGDRQMTIQSRFLNELSSKLGIKQSSRFEDFKSGFDKFREKDDIPSPSKSFGVSSNFSGSFARTNTQPNNKAFTGSSPRVGVSNKQDDYSAFKSGKKVIHKKFGQGTIISVKPNGNNTTCDVAFPGFGVKSFAVAFAPMEVID